MQRLGITLPLERVPLDAQRALLGELADLGYSDVWSQEVAGHDAFTPLAWAAAWAPATRLGTAIAGVFTRGPALLAMQAAALAELAPGRFVLGLGASSPAIVAGWNAVRFERPYARVRDSLRFLRRALAGERVDSVYETFRVQRFQLERPVAKVPIVIAALGPRMLALAAEEADGVALSLVGPADVTALLKRSPSPPGEVVLRIAVFPTSDAGRARDAARKMLAPYLAVPAYARMHEALGRASLVRELAERVRSGDRRGAAALLPDALIDELVIHGSPERCRERIAAFRKAGVGTPVLAISALGGDPVEAARGLAPRR